MENELTKNETAEVVKDESANSKRATKKPAIAKKINPDQIVTVKNGFQGKLIYKSSKTRERFVWDSFGDEQDMELGELKNARNSSKKYFINNWFMFDEPWIIDYLGMRQYYKYAISIEGFDEIFEKPADEVEDIIGKLSEGQKKSVSYRAKQLISEGKIDSNKLISTLEKCLNTELIER